MPIVSFPLHEFYGLFMNGCLSVSLCTILIGPKIFNVMQSSCLSCLLFFVFVYFAVCVFSFVSFVFHLIFVVDFAELFFGMGLVLRRERRSQLITHAEFIEF